MVLFVAVATWRFAGSATQTVLVLLGMLVGCALFAAFPSAHAGVRRPGGHRNALTIWALLSGAVASLLALRALHLVEPDLVGDLTKPAGPPVVLLVPVLLAFTAVRVALMSLLYQFGNRSLRSGLDTVTGTLVVLLAQVEVLLQGTGAVPQGVRRAVDRRLVRVRRLIADDLWPHLPLTSSDPQEARRHAQAAAWAVDRARDRLLRCGPDARSAVQEYAGQMIAALSQGLYGALPVADRPARIEKRPGAGRILLAVLNAVVPLAFLGLVRLLGLNLPDDVQPWFTLFAVCWPMVSLLVLTGRDNARILRTLRDLWNLFTGGSPKE